MAQPLTQYDFDKTPLDMADKAQFMSHVNEEHQDELAMFINAFTTTAVSEHEIASIAEPYTDGILMDVTTAHHDDDTLTNSSKLSRQYFIDFTVPISDSMTLQEQYITLLQTSANKLGKRTIKLQEQRFTVINGYYASPNMYRLLVTAPDSTPLSHPGYAYLFELDADGLSATKHQSKDHSRDSDKPLQRYYTLRKAWRDSSSSSVQAWIDVYIHGDTAGGSWARALNCGSQIKTVREYPEKIEHLSTGQCLLICDETSLPTVANLLENWQNPLPPLVIAITNDPEDISYLHTLTLSNQLRHEAHFLQDNVCQLVNAPTTDITEQIMTLLNTQFARLPVKIDKVWGALEAADIKSLRQQLKTNLGLSRQDMVIKVYWRAQ
ncbi:siderophore-interacting protein [Psychrobacter sp. JCM 18902]|uniref:siderophore-interacting protein n=1 Tax=Psychrobacter sp. JCM 18902 TaxID=1298607 RepID=UPI00191A06C2|nr:siderophore-interacting protein [Psychrobacter sp. JCM 18902]